VKWNIIADSAIDLFRPETESEDIFFETVPFAITVGDREYIDDKDLSLDELVDALKASKTASKTACPAPGAWLEYFRREGNVIAITITGALSGSYASACAAKDMLLEEQPDKRIEIIDSKSTGPEMIMILRKLITLINCGLDFENVLHEIHSYMNTTHTVFALSSFDNLVKNGRMNRLTGFIANKLGLIGIGIASEKGTIEIKGVSRGRKRAIETIKHDMTHRGAFIKDVIISHCRNSEFAEQLKAAIVSEWQGANVTILSTRGLCGYYAEENGLIISY